MIFNLIEVTKGISFLLQPNNLMNLSLAKWPTYLLTRVKTQKLKDPLPGQISQNPKID